MYMHGHRSVVEIQVSPRAEAGRAREACLHGEGNVEVQAVVAGGQVHRLEQH